MAKLNNYHISCAYIVNQRLPQAFRHERTRTSSATSAVIHRYRFAIKVSFKGFTPTLMIGVAIAGGCGVSRDENSGWLQFCVFFCHAYATDE